MRIKRDRIYCYVSKEGVTPTRAAQKGAWLDGRQVDSHPDFTWWIYGKPVTRAIQGQSGWRGAAAKAVCKEMGWE
jgi:hypothetical protein